MLYEAAVVRKELIHPVFRMASWAFLMSWGNETWLRPGLGSPSAFGLPCDHWERRRGKLCLPSGLDARLECALEPAVFFCADFWHSALFLYTLVSHPTTIPDIQRLAGHGYFYWKMRNLCKLLFSFFSPLSFFFSFLFFFLSPEEQGLQVVWNKPEA